MILHIRDDIAAYNRLMADSFFQFTGTEIVPGARDLDDGVLAEDIFLGPVPIVSHGTEADPTFRYGNVQALKLWEMAWEDFIGLPSRCSAEPESDIQIDRNRLLKSALDKGFVDNYSGIRISSQGRRFEIRNTVLWNVVDRDGTRHGQAAFIRDWRYI